ncbi:MAG: hemerythrin-like metal-binding protein [Deltaproteobacteria bacterium]|nr:hemerythrin-like metal-binding protein [Deltaproteobacteria bacterium]
MAYMEWNETLSVQVREIDAQHKKLIECVNRLHQAMLDNRGKELHKEIIDEMCDYAASHFALEEMYMQRFNYAACEEHRKEHEKFAKEAAELKARADRGGLILTVVMLSFLKDWLQNHILGTDMKYVEHFKRRGLM